VNQLVSEWRGENIYSLPLKNITNNGNVS
jgi:hypothetical protein